MASESVRLYLTAPHACSYLENRIATTAFVDPEAGIDTALYSVLSAQGYRRSGTHIYRPHCGVCAACVPVRLPVEIFTRNRQQKRTYKHNADLIGSWSDNILNDECYALYARYISSRHGDGDMNPPTYEQFERFLLNPAGYTRYLMLRDLAGVLLAVAVTDVLANACSAVYTFYDPDQASRSLGVFGVLKQIEETRKMGKEYLYLGYWIKECQKMSYKSTYQPLEMLVDGQWIPAKQSSK